MFKPVYTDKQKNRIEELVTLLNDYTKLYDEGKPAISDKEWDDLYFELLSLEEETGLVFNNSPSQKVVFTAVSALEKKEHNHQMLSLDKTKDIAEVASFLHGAEYIAMNKMDGLTCSLRYVDGRLVSAETRGNGLIGENILHNARVISNIPKAISYKEELIVDGEVICDYESFKEFANEYKNPRNFAAGSIRLLDAKECATRKLSFVAWDVIVGFNSCTKVSRRLDKLAEYGFTVVPFTSGNGIEKDIEKLKLSASTFGYPIDGVVFKFDDIEYGKSLGQTEHHFKNAIAFKFYDEEVETTLRDIEWTMGRTGVLTPVAIYDDVEIEGSICNRASLHNISVMNEVLGTAYSGQPIKVFKANMIIPQISWAKPLDIVNDNDKGFKIIDEPCHCPICGGDTTIKDNDGVKTLWCTNPTCDGKLSQKIDHFCSKKGLDIKGLSLATIEKLIDWGWLNNVKDLYSLDAHKKEWISKPGFGEKSVQKIIDAIENSKTCQWSAFVSALGIPLIGTTVSKELAKLFDSYQEFRKYVDTDDCWFDEFDGFGPEMDKSLKEFDYTEADEIAAMLNFEQQEVQSEAVTSAAGITFCITGKVNVWKNRDALKAYIESIGGKVVGSMSSKVNYLINNDNTSTSAKNVAAKKAGIPIITEAEFIDAFGQN